MSAVQSLNYRSLLVVGICLPAVLAAVDRVIASTMSFGEFSPEAIVLVFAFFVLQVAVVSWAVARFIDPWPLRWFLWVWTMALIDLQLIVMSGQEGHDSTRVTEALAAAMLAGQLGALLVWGILGSGLIRWRIPSLLVVLLVWWNFFGVLTRAAQWPHTARFGWDDLLFVESTVLTCLCIGVRISRFRLSLLREADSPSLQAGPGLQFSIRHVLIGTTILAVLLGLAKAGDLLTAKFVQQLSGESAFFVFSVACGTATVLLTELWAALGRGNGLMRTIVAIGLPLCIGGAITWYCVTFGRLKMFGVNAPYWMFVWYDMGYWWLGFMVLTATLLASSLLIFRTLGYRLVRQRTSETVHLLSARVS